MKGLQLEEFKVAVSFGTKKFYIAIVKNTFRCAYE